MIDNRGSRFVAFRPALDDLKNSLVLTLYCCLSLKLDLPFCSFCPEPFKSPWRRIPNFAKAYRLVIWTILVCVILKRWDYMKNFAAIIYKAGIPSSPIITLVIKIKMIIVNHRYLPYNQHDHRQSAPSLQST